MFEGTSYSRMISRLCELKDVKIVFYTKVCPSKISSYVVILWYYICKGRKSIVDIAYPNNHIKLTDSTGEKKLLIDIDKSIWLRCKCAHSP